MRMDMVSVVGKHSAAKDLIFDCLVCIDMRKAMPRDEKRETVRDGKLGRNTIVSPE